MKDGLMITTFGQLKLEDVIGRPDLGRHRLAPPDGIAGLSGEIVAASVKRFKERLAAALSAADAMVGFE